MPPDETRHLIVPEWGAAPGVRALSTLRHGGTSRGAHGLAGGARGGWNLGLHCGDDPAAVRANRARLIALLPGEPLWLEQVHGIEVFDADRTPSGEADGAMPPDREAASAAVPRADAAITTRRGVVLAVLTADCVPVLLADALGAGVGVAHAGWRGLAAGVLERTVAALAGKLAAPALRAWLGPAIGPSRFEVGDEVRRVFVAADPAAHAAFRPGGAPDKWLADLFLLARQRLVRCGVTEIYGGRWCTASSEEAFYSYRRDRVTGRMASTVWID